MNDEIIFACERKLAQALSRIETLEAQREGDRAEVQSARKDVQELKRRLDKVAHLLVAMGDRVDWDSRSTVVYTWLDPHGQPWAVGLAPASDAEDIKRLDPTVSLSAPMSEGAADTIASSIDEYSMSAAAVD